MKKIVQSLLFLAGVLLQGCATEIAKSSAGAEFFEIRQHYSNSSQAEAESMANAQCSRINASPQFVDFKKGCLLECGSEFHHYTFKCVSNARIAQTDQAGDKDLCAQWGFQEGTENFGYCMLRLAEMRSASNRQATQNLITQSAIEQSRRATERTEALRDLENSLRLLAPPERRSKPLTTCRQTGEFINCF